MKKKILFIIHDLGYGGAEKVLVNLANNLDKTKYDVTIKTMFDIGVNKNNINGDVKYIGGWKFFLPRHTKIMKLFPPKILFRMLVHDDYDLVISFLEGSPSRIVSAFSGKKIAWIHVEHFSVDSLCNNFKNKQEMITCYNNFDRIICVSETVKQNFASFFDVKPRLQVLYNVNETSIVIQKSFEQQTEIKSKCGILNLVSVGRLSIKHKGFERLISVHKKLIDNGINNKLYILGEGADRHILQKQINESHVSNTCFLLGFDENPYKYVSKADLFICSSYKEGFSTAVTEALILGVPVVSTEVSGAKELLGKNNEYGIVTDNNEDALYSGVYRILTEPGLLEYYRKKAKIRGKEFSTEKTTKAVEEMLDKIL